MAATSARRSENRRRPPSTKLDGAYTANIDGAARGNPGPASYGVVLRRPDGKPLESIGKYIGRHTNNVAEYYALIHPTGGSSQYSYCADLPSVSPCSP